MTKLNIISVSDDEMAGEGEFPNCIGVKQSVNYAKEVLGIDVGAKRKCRQVLFG